VKETIHVPNIGDFEAVDVIEVLVSVGDEIALDTPLLTLESDKAALEVPSTLAGKVVEVLVKVGDQVGEGHAICVVDVAAETASAAPTPDAPAAAPAAAAPTPPPSAPVAAPMPPTPPTLTTGVPVSAPAKPLTRDEAPAGTTAHASPAVRQFARELGVEVALVPPSGPKGRILKEDVQAYVKKRMAQPEAAAGSLGLPAAPSVDFAKFGEVVSRPLSRIRLKSAANLHRNWLLATMVTQFDEADITELEAFRKVQDNLAKQQGRRVSILPFVVKAVAHALRLFPDFNSSLDETGQAQIFKQYINIGVAVDTPNGLVVPVVRGADAKGVLEIADELALLSARAREGKSLLDDFQGGTFTISSLGGIGGTAFTPIVNVPEVAILGVSRAVTKPVFAGDAFVPRLMLPLSLTYDHRVIDGALGARFAAHLSKTLGDMRQLIL